MSTDMPETVAVMPETVTVRPETVVLKPGRHSHGSNFGRYVEGCPQCAKKWPDGPPQRVPRRAKRVIVTRYENSKTMRDMQAAPQQIPGSREILSGGILSEMSRGISESPSPQAQSINAAGSQKSELPQLRESISDQGTSQETTMREMREPEVTKTPQQLRQTASGSMVMPDMPHQTSPSAVTMTRDEMIAALKAQGFRIADGSPETAVQAAEASFAPALDINMLTEAMRVLGTELRRADPEVEEEKRAKKIREQLAKEAERETIRLAAEQTKARQAYCRSLGHRQDEGRSTNSAVSGQFCTGDQMFHWICVVCQETGVRKPHPSEMTMGVA